jgi:hypothetical protein
LPVVYALLNVGACSAGRSSTKAGLLHAPLLRGAAAGERLLKNTITRAGAGERLLRKRRENEAAWWQDEAARTQGQGRGELGERTA